MPRKYRTMPRWVMPIALAAALTMGIVLIGSDPGSRMLPPALTVQHSAAADEQAEGQAAPEDEEEEQEDQRTHPDDDPSLVIRGKTRDGRTIHEAPSFTVRPRTGDLEYYPCSDCHEGEEVNPRERKLTEEHEDIVLVHGGGRFWCLTCHNLTKDSDSFISLKGKAIDFNNAFLLCGQCHFDRQKDWYFGGHGKRSGAFPTQREIPATFDQLKVEERETIGNWQGERKLLSCPTCHNPHTPSIKPYQPSPPPQVRRGLARNPLPEKPRVRIWDRLSGKTE